MTSSNDVRRLIVVRPNLRNLSGVDIERQLMVLNPCGLPHDAVSASLVCRGRLFILGRIACAARPWPALEPGVRLAGKFLPARLL